MLKQIDNINADTASAVSGFFAQSATGVYTLISLLDWAAVDAAWVQTQGEDITALVVQKEMSKLYVTANEKSDCFELADFIADLGGMVVHCASDITARIGVTAFSKHSLMVLEDKADSLQTVEILSGNLRSAFDLLTQSKNKILENSLERKDIKKFTDKAYKEWLSKVRQAISDKSSSLVGAFNDNGQMLCVALAQRLDDVVYLNSVACDSELKKSDAQAECVKAICRKLRNSNEKILVSCDDIRTENFYKKIGFERKDYLELGIVEL